ncbi:amidohydrolase family protein [Mycobacterium gordonae]|uniref:amidohydrolase family protein n=1 Tax=Mycobacterium gordonae TaxID=1778 RepID=UPI002109FAF7|nr:amidohydrolase family protein [Mycobacterium gordonae]MCQ4361404.1 amidohydrolase family protein [Mycobacterium gordonae]
MSEWTIGAVLDAVADAVPDRVMTVCGDRRRTFAESADRTRRLANFLAAKGFGAHTERTALGNWECGQDRVALVMHNDLYPDMVIACVKARVVPVNVNHYYTPREVSEVLAYVKPRGVIYHRSLGAKIADAGVELLICVDDGSEAPELDGAVELEEALAQGDCDHANTPSPDDLLMICTGGTTGRPKGVLWRQADMYVASMNGDDHADVGEIHRRAQHRGGSGTPARQRQGGLPVGHLPRRIVKHRKDNIMTPPDPRPVIDCLVNVHFGEAETQPDFMTKVRDDYFKGPPSMFDPVDLAELLDEMDEHGVRKAILMDNLAKPSVTARKFADERPDRFALAMGGMNLLRPVKSMRELTAVAAGLPVAYAVVGPSFWADGQYPPSDAVYYPLYAKCAEIELALCVNTGLPGPPIPGEVQNPVHLDRVCVRFPELKLCMIHGADPWWDIAIRMLIKYRNLRLMTSAWSPKRLPDSLLHFMRTRGPDKVIFASDWPVLRQHRVVPEANALDLPAHVLDNYLYHNADKFFFGADTDEER